MDSDATAALNQKGIATTDDSFKFIWFKVDLHFISYLSLEYKRPVSMKNICYYV